MVSRPLRWLALAFLCAFLTSGCFQKQYRRFSYGVQAETARQIYSPMTVGQRALVHALPHIACSQVLFALAAQGGVQRLKRPLAEADLVDETKAVFFTPASPESVAGSPLLYFNPRRLSIQKLPPAGAAASKNGFPPSGDLVPTAPGRFALVRSIPVGSKGEKRCLVRFDFAYNDRGALRCLRRQVLTDGRHFDYMPAPAAATQRVIFLRRESKGQNRLMDVSLHNGRARAVFRRQDFNVRFTWRGPDGRTLFSANPEGYYRPYTLKTAPAADGRRQPPLFAPFAGNITRAPETGLILASAGRTGDFRPVLVRLPTTCDLRTVCALVQAQNPQVNRMRALLAAAMIDAGQAKLANWPALHFGLLYTPLVGVFLAKPIVYSGDFLAESIARGLVGVVQPLFDFKKNVAKAEARYYRAKIAHDNVLNEINERIAEAAGLYFQARYLSRLAALQKAQIDAMRRRYAYYQRLRTKAESTLEDLLATEQVIDGLESERDFHLRRLAFVKNRLKALCGLPRQQRLALSGEKFAFNDYVPEPLAQLRTTALLNHPALKAARAALSQSFYLGKTGSPLRPTAYFSGVYAQGRRHFTNPVDDYINLSLYGQYPLAAHKSAKLNDAYWQATLHALQIQRRIQARRVAESLEEAYMDFQASRRDFVAKQATLLYRLEKLRLARVHLRYGPAGSTAHISPVDEINARFDYLGASIRTAKVKMDLGLRYAKLWREMGLSSRLADESSQWREDFLQRRKASLWLWRTRQVLKSTDSIREFTRFCARQHIRRVYAYLYSDSRLLENNLYRERLVILLNFCDRAGIKIWALLGEPEWLTAKSHRPLASAVTRILAFNAGLRRFEPRIAGLKIDLEPYSLPGWHTRPAKRRQLAHHYIALLQAASIRVKGKLPLWVDIPVQYLRPENQPLLHRIQRYVDGATLMAYSSRPQKILQNGLIALKRFDGPLEVGIELSRHAPRSDRLPDWPFQKLRRVVQTLQNAWLRQDNYAGMALHDYRALKKRPVF